MPAGNNMECRKCGSRIFLVEKTTRCAQVDGKTIEELPSMWGNRECVRCTNLLLHLCFGKLREEE